MMKDECKLKIADCKLQNVGKTLRHNRRQFSIFNFQFAICNLLLLLSVAQAADERKAAIPFDFVSKFDDGRYGRMVGELVWKKLERDGGFILPETIGDVREYCAAHKLSPSPEMELEAMGKIVREHFGAQVGIWGSVERVPGTGEDAYDLTIKCVDFSDTRPKVHYDVKARTKTVSEIPHLYVRQMLDALKGRKPGEVGKGESPHPAAEPSGPSRQSGTDPLAAAAEDNWKNEPNLIAGDFERGADGVPAGWDKTAGQQRAPLGTEVRWTTEKNNPANRVARFVLDKNTAENAGVMYYSDYFPIEEGAKYRFQCRWRSDGPAVKVFVKCYDYFPDEARRREVYRSQQNLQGPGNAWNTHAEDFTPRHSKYAPRWGRVMLYAYLKPGEVEFDDVIVKRIVPVSPGERD
ncbi:MAG: hypothetical protein GX594_18770 [Pirellulaceae bacterium]|mgnify:CR=1 FL=1|nr:hypothetical protein [Pirellulaceae bacterium]